jgi:Fic family protein
MPWNWQRPEWPNFRWESERLALAEKEFLIAGGVLAGMARHLAGEAREQLAVEAMSAEAVTTSEIEGEVLDRASVQSSIRRQLGLTTDRRRIKPAEQGVAEMMVDLYRSFAEPVSDELLFRWHRMLMAGRRDLTAVGRYRTGAAAMQIVSGAMGARKIHFEAPPSTEVPKQMAQFIAWSNRSAPEGSEPLPALAKAGVAHLYFESIHPFEDGNGRIGRALAEKSLSQSLGAPAMTALAATILARRKNYYQALESACRQIEIAAWLAWFAGTVIEAQRRTIALIEFLIGKAKLFDRLRGQINPRQEKALLRMFAEGPEGFKGGLTAGKYVAITGASPATATRDLVDLVEKGALIRIGERRYALYQFATTPVTVKHVELGKHGELLES